jgi:hypothetical protein
LEINRKTDKNLVIQLMVDSLKMLPANPSFLDARDAMFDALWDMWMADVITTSQFDGAWQAMWKVFCKYGMGPGAASNGAQLDGIVADHELGQHEWRRCSQCRVLFFGPAPSKCPKSALGHSAAGSPDYDLVLDWPFFFAPGDASWRFCKNCAGLFTSGGASKCPVAGNPAHNGLGSGTYSLVFNVAGTAGDATWRRCSKCGGLVSTSLVGSGVECPGGGLHSVITTLKYSLVSR